MMGGSAGDLFWVCEQHFGVKAARRWVRSKGSIENEHLCKPKGSSAFCGRSVRAQAHAGCKGGRELIGHAVNPIAVRRTAQDREEIRLQREIEQQCRCVGFSLNQLGQDKIDGDIRFDNGWLCRLKTSCNHDMRKVQAGLPSGGRIAACMADTQLP